MPTANVPLWALGERGAKEWFAWDHTSRAPCGPEWRSRVCEPGTGEFCVPFSPELCLYLHRLREPDTGEKYTYIKKKNININIYLYMYIYM